MRIEYKLQEWNGGKVWVEEAYPNILFAKDGEIYDIAGMKTIVIKYLPVIYLFRFCE